MPSTGPESGTRPALRVAAGCLQRPDGAVLICQRPPHKIYPGEWEFPGGKIEPGETAREALRRELHEELGIEVTGCQPLLRVRHDYPELAVELDVWRVSGWVGTVRSGEHPQVAWAKPAEMGRWPLLAANRAIVTALRLPGHYVFTPPAADMAAIRAGLSRLPGGALLRLRLPGLADEAYARLAHGLRPACEAHGLWLMLDRDPGLARELGCGWHATAQALAGLRARPLPEGAWFAASCHDAAELAAARAVQADFMVLGPVRATPTHPGAAALGWARFAALAPGAGAPVYAIGGVGPAQQDEAAAHGARGVAGISAYWGLPAGAGGSPSSSGIV